MTHSGNVLLGLRGPAAPDGGALALEIALPAEPDQEPVLVKQHAIPPVNVGHIPPGAAKTLRAVSPVDGSAADYFVLLGPIGYEKEVVVLARWNAETGELSQATALPDGFVGEGLVPIPGVGLLVVDDREGRIMIATEP